MQPSLNCNRVAILFFWFLEKFYKNCHLKILWTLNTLKKIFFIFEYFSFIYLFSVPLIASNPSSSFYLYCSMYRCGLLILFSNGFACTLIALATHIYTQGNDASIYVRFTSSFALWSSPFGLVYIKCHTMKHSGLSRCATHNQHDLIATDNYSWHIPSIWPQSDSTMNVINWHC